MQGLKHFRFDLADVQFKRVFACFERHIDKVDEEFIVGDKVQQFEMFHTAVHFAASFRGKYRRKEVVSALDAAFEQRLAVSAKEVAEIIRRDIHRARTRCAKSHRKTIAEIQQHFGRMEASITDRFLALFHRLLHKLVVRLLQQVFKVDEML